jgi:hypothetical protein
MLTHLNTVSSVTIAGRVTTKLAVYAHLFDSDHADLMAALEAMNQPVSAPNVVPMRRGG